LNAFPSEDQTSYFVIPSFLSLFFLVISLLIFGMRRTEAADRAFALFASSLSIVTGSLFDLFTTHYLTYIWTLGCAVAGGAIINLAVSFPQEIRFVARRPYLRWLGLVFGLILTGYAYTTLFNFSQPTAYITAWRYIYIFVAVAVLFYLAINTCYLRQNLSSTLKYPLQVPKRFWLSLRRLALLFGHAIEHLWSIADVIQCQPCLALS